MMGSHSDWETMRHAAATLEQLEIAWEARVLSAHRTPDETAAYAAAAAARGIQVLIAAAGGAAALPGAVAAKTDLPVIGVPMKGWATDGLDSLLSMAQMPRGVPVATVAIGLDYRGLSVGEMQELRRAIYAEAPDTELRVVKNSLLARAAANAGVPAAANVAQEATALLLGDGDLTDAPRALRAYTRSSSREIPVHGVFFEGAFSGGETVAELAAIPPRVELMARVAGGLNSPVSGIAAALSAVFRDLAALVEARAEQLETAEPA